MATFQYKGQGLRSVGAYQVSGRPYITGSCGTMDANEESRIRFPSVTKSVTVIASGTFTTGELRVHFNSASAGAVHDGATSAVSYPLMHHYISLRSDESAVTFNVKCREIYVTAIGSTAGYELFAELTGIPRNSMFDITGSGLTSHSETGSLTY